MNDYIFLPKILDSIHSLINGNLKKFLMSCRELDSNKLHLDELRKLYLRNKSEFINIVDELSLRGFSFHTEKPNNLLTSGELEISSYILASEDQGRYQDIDFQSFGLTGFINRFQSKSDIFFHKIPIEGFKRINGHLNIALLEKELLKVGFKLLDIKSGMVKEQENSKENDGDTGAKSETDKNDLNVPQPPPSVVEVFTENIYRSFLDFCKKENIQTVDQINEFVLEKYANCPGVGTGKLDSVRRKLVQYIPLEMESSVSGAQNLDVKEIFNENIFRTFLEFCEKKRLQTIDQITDKVLDQYAQSPGVGIGKVQAVRTKIELLNLSDENKSVPGNQSNKIKDLFSEFRFRTFLDYCNKKGIHTIEEIRERHYEEYSSLRGVGVGKVDAVKEIVKQSLGLRQRQKSDEKQPARIQDVFFEGVFLSFLRFCKKNNISIISEITEDHLTEYGNTYGVGVGKVEAVRQRLSQVTDLKEVPKGNSNELSIGLHAAHVDIENIFMDSKYTLFRVYCKKHGIKTLGDLKKHHLEEYGKERMVGRKKVEEVRNVLSIYLDSDPSSSQVFESGEIYKAIKTTEVQALLYNYGLQTNSQSKLRIQDIEGKEFVLLKEEFEPHLLLILSELLKRQKLPKEILSGIKKSLSERDHEIIQYRLGEEKTLEEVGSRFGVTRERVRQIVVKRVRKIVGYYLKRQNFSNSIRLISLQEKYLTGAEMESLLGEEFKFVIKIIKNEGVPFQYYKRLDLFLLDEEVKMDFSMIDSLIEELPDFFNINDFKQQVEEAFENIGIEDQSTVLLNHLFESESYKKYGDFYSRTKLSIHEVLSFLFKHYIPGPLRIDDDGVAYLQELAKKHLDFDMSSNLRSIDARIRDAKEVFLVDPATFQYFDTEHFDFTFIQKIEKFLNEQFKNRDVINVEEVFQHFYDELMLLRIKTKYHLYSLIRYYLDENFVIGQGNTLNIFSNEKSRVSLEDRLIACMKKAGGICTKESLLEIISPMYKVDLAISHSDKIIPWGTNQAILVKNIKLSSSDKNQLIEFVKKGFHKGYTTTNYLYKEMLFDRKISSIVNNIGVDEPAKLPSFIKLLLPNVKGHSNFLYLEGCELDSFEKVIELTFQSETSRLEIKNLAFEYGYKDMMASLFTKRLIEQGIYVEVDFDQLYPDKYIELSDSVLAEVKAYVQAEQGSMEYLSLSNLKGYRRKLPDIGFRWNAYLLNSVLQRCGYRQVKKIINDYRYDKIIVVKEDSRIQTFEDLIVYILENEYRGNMHEYSFYDFLVEKGILKEQEYNHKKVLPAELKNSERLEFDNLGYLKVRQVR
jgi:hypothetical protein